MNLYQENKKVSESHLILQKSLQMLNELPEALGNKRNEDRLERHSYALIHRIVELNRGEA
jgi:hypothetical protein